MVLSTIFHNLKEAGHIEETGLMTFRLVRKENKELTSSYLEIDNLWERNRRIKRLGDTGGDSAVELLIAVIQRRVLKDGPPLVRALAAEALGKIGGKRAEDALISAVMNKSEDYEVAWEAARALGVLDIEGLITLMNCCEDEGIQGRAAHGLAKIWFGNRGYHTELTKLYEW